MDATWDCLPEAVAVGAHFAVQSSRDQFEMFAISVGDAMLPNHELEMINGLLRGELAAVETYSQVLEKLYGDRGRDELKLIRAEHHNAVNILRQHIARVRDDIDIDSGIWSRFVEALIGTAKVVDNFVALQALREGEQSGVQSYEQAMDDPNLSDDFRTIIRIRLLPQTQAHIPILDRLMNSQV